MKRPSNSLAHVATVRFVFWRLAGPATACVCALAAATATADGLAWHDGRVAAIQPDKDLITAAGSSTPRTLFEAAGEIVQSSEPRQASALEPGLSSLWQSPASTGGQVPGALQLDRDCASLEIKGANPIAVLTEGVHAPSPVVATTSSSADKASGNGTGAGPMKSSASLMSRSAEPAIWVIGAIVACGLGVAGLRGPFWATRWTPVRRGLKP